jgi:PTH2 family peptidyl-tRNA hydrolase
MKRNDKPTKQVVVWNAGLRNKEGHKVRTGKAMAQASHAAMAFMTRTLRKEDGKIVLELQSEEEALEWMKNSFTQIILKVNSDEELMEIYNKAIDAGLVVHLITDLSRSRTSKKLLT